MEYSFHLTLAVSRGLDVIAEHKVQDLNRVEDHEPLAEACYAFQAQQYVPDDIHYQKDLATAIFISHAGNPVVKYAHLRDKNTWKAEFFSPNGLPKLLRESSTVKRC
ncbi:hypothetical protein BGZ47_002920, partial [Haplosporangium gracile]